MPKIKNWTKISKAATSRKATHRWSHNYSDKEIRVVKQPNRNEYYVIGVDNGDVFLSESVHNQNQGRSRAVEWMRENP